MTAFIPEWERQTATIIAMPHKNSDWKPYLAEAQGKISEIITQIARFQKVIVLYESPSDISHLSDKSNVILLKIPLNDSWCRDFSPISIKKDSKLILLDFIFNAWGAKYACDLDNLAGKRLFKQMQKYKFFAKRYSDFKAKNFILEGGSIDSNGETLLTTTQCLLSKNRNRLSKKQISQKLKKYLGVKNIVWLKNGFLEGDDTDCHIDNLARFIDKNTIVYLKCYDRFDTHFRALEAMEQELKKLPFSLVPLPLPKATFYQKRRLPASYVNFIFVNNAMLVPTFGDSKNDAIAISTFQKLAKNKEIIPIDSSVLIRQGGGLHCLTMNLM